METISFKIIYDFIKNELMKKSIDSVFNNSHEYFENNIFCKDKMIHKILVSGLIKIDEIDEKSILECDESFIEKSFEVWAEENLEKIEFKYSQIKNKEDLLFIYKTDIDIEEETKLYNEIYKILLGRIDNKIHEKTFFCDFLSESNLFKESFPINQNIDYEKVKKTLLGVLNTPIPSKTKNSYIKSFRKLYREDGYQTLNQYNNPDDVAAIYLAILSSYNDKNVIRTDSGIIYINFGNGIFAKLLIRKNVDNIVEDILLIGKSILSRSNLKDEYNSIYNNKYIFSGYTDSGYITNVGLYLITKELVFEIYFEASSLLIDNKHIPLFQSISDSKKKDDVDYQRNM